MQLCLFNPKIEIRRYFKVCMKRILYMITGLPNDILIKILELTPRKEAVWSIVLSKRWRHASYVFYFMKKWNIYRNQPFGRKKDVMKDHISELPDDIIIKILEKVPMKEAGRTSVLAKRWRHTWSHVPLLNFDPGFIYLPMMLDEDTWYAERLPLEKLRYLRWVEQVISSHKAPTIAEFRLLFEFADRDRSYIDNWVKFAVDKKVERLELHFGGIDIGSHRFPYNVPTTSLSLCNTLTSLQLAYVNVTGELLERVIYNCQALELLSVANFKLLVDLKIVGPSLNLKFLKIVCCLRITSLEISAPNLLSFHYFGPKLNLMVKSTPVLAEISIHGICCIHLLDGSLEFSSCFSRIEVLRLLVPIRFNIVKVFPIFEKLKVLDVTIEPVCGEDLFRFSSLIKACPILHTFVLQPRSLVKLDIKESEWKWDRETCPHEHLKVAEIVGFVGCKFGIGFVKHLLEIAVSLEKFIIDTRLLLDVSNPDFVGTPWESTKKETVKI